MDDRRFDRLTRALGGATTRRAGIGAALAGAIGTALWSSGASGLNQTEPQGPCGDGSGPANRCRAHSDCCTNFCDKAASRCRCIGRGAPCKSNQRCCGASVCVKGVCGSGQPTSTPQPTATPTDTPVPTATPTGTLTPSPTPTNTPVPPPCTVCSSGCPYTTVAAAIAAAPAGSTITVAPGTWVTTAVVSRNLSIEACTAMGGTVDTVILKEASPAPGYILRVNVLATLTLESVTLLGNGAADSNAGLDVRQASASVTGIHVEKFGQYGALIVGGSLVTTDSVFSNNATGVRLVASNLTSNSTDYEGDGKRSLHALLISKTTKDSSSAEFNGGLVTGFVDSAFLLESSTAALNLTIDGTVIRDNIGGYKAYGAAINAADGAHITLKGATEFRDNQAAVSPGSNAPDGGAILIEIVSNADQQLASLKIVGSEVVFRNNEALKGPVGRCTNCGGAISVDCNKKSQMEFSRVQAATYTRNTPLDCALYQRSVGGGAQEVPNCNYG